MEMAKKQPEIMCDYEYKPLSPLISNLLVGYVEFTAYRHINKHKMAARKKPL